MARREVLGDNGREIPFVALVQGEAETGPDLPAIRRGRGSAPVVGGSGVCVW